MKTEIDSESVRQAVEKLAVYRRVRDEIRRFVEGLPGNLDHERHEKHEK